MNRIGFILLTACMPLLASCGMSAHPVVRDTPPAPGVRPPQSTDPNVVRQPYHDSSITRRVCRSGSRPRGWIAIAYEQDARTCPKPSDDDNGYTVAVLIRHSDRPVGTRLEVCADAGVPPGWSPLPDAVEGAQCAGARVSEGAQTARLIQRIR